MQVLFCPGCQWQALDRRHESSFFHCSRCLKKWCIIDVDETVATMDVGAQYGSLGIFQLEDGMPVTRLNQIDKGVTL